MAAEDMGKSMVGQTVSLCGWVKTAREAGTDRCETDVRPLENCERGQADKGKLYFIQLNDGSIPLDIQADFLLYCVSMVR